MAFVALGPANRVAVIDTASRTVRDYVLVGQRPWHMDLSPDGAKLYVGQRADNDMTIIDVPSLTASVRCRSDACRGGLPCNRKATEENREVFLSSIGQFCPRSLRSRAFVRCSAKRRPSDEPYDPPAGHRHVGFALVAGGVSAAAAATTGKQALELLNKDGDSTFEVVEVIDWGTKLFAAINPDGDSTLEPDETEGRLTEADWAAVNKDGDQYAGDGRVAEHRPRRFEAADADKDGKLTEAELDAPAGQSLLLVLVK